MSHSPEPCREDDTDYGLFDACQGILPKSLNQAVEDGKRLLMIAQAAWPAWQAQNKTGTSQKNPLTRPSQSVQSM